MSTTTMAEELQKPKSIMAYIEERYMPVTESGCWIWLLSQTANGYASGNFKGKRRSSVHRWIYEETKGPIPEGMHIDHLCRVRCCINPAHLEAVTPKENVHRGIGVCSVNAHKTHCINGHPFSGDNLKIRKTGRYCFACHLERQRKNRLLAKTNKGVFENAN